MPSNNPNPPDIDGVLFLLKQCFESIGMNFNTPAEMQAFSIKALVQEIEDAEPTDWNASLQMWVDHVKQTFAENPYYASCVLIGFDVAWLKNNQNKNVGNLIAYLLNGHIIMV